MICDVCGEGSCGAKWDDPMGAASPGEYEEAMIRHWRLGYERSRSSLAAAEQRAEAAEKHLAEALATYHAQVDATGAAQQAADGVRERVRERVLELEGALRAAKNLTHLQHANPATVRWVGEEVGRIVDAALHDEERSAPPQEGGPK